jgi:hypothetical protein
VTALEILRAARAKISHADAWTKGALSRDACGLDLHLVPEGVTLSPPVCWCPLGAIFACAELPDCIDGAVTRTLERGEARHQLSLTAGLEIVSFNDHATTTHADILRVFDKTIARLEANA